MQDQENPPKTNKNIKIPTEQEIKKNYRLRLKDDLTRYENENN